MLEAQIRMALDSLSNGEFSDLTIEQRWIDEAVESFREALTAQLTNTGRDEFRLRMSNVGRPTCQLQMEASGAEKARKPYHFIMSMMFGDAIEAITELVLKIAKANITGGKNQVELHVEDTVIKGTDDIEIDGKVYDIKSSSPWAYQYKWSKGYDALKDNDSFGYVSQLFGYAEAQNKAAGGWIVVNKSTGELSVVEVDASPHEPKIVMSAIANTVRKIKMNEPFERCFEPEIDTWRNKPTGLKRLQKECEFCSYLGSCWPDAKYQAHPNSTAKSPKHYWFVTEDD